MNVLLEINDSLAHLPAGVVAMLFAVALGYVLKSAGFFPNKYIPAVVVPIAALLYALIQLCADKIAAKEHAGLYFLLNFAIGFLYGFFAWGAHAAILRRFIDPKVFNDDGSTKFFTKPPTDDSKPDS